MPDDKTQPGKDRSTPAASSRSASDETKATKPADSELRFQHLIRNMVVARDQARRTRD